VLVQGVETTESSAAEIRVSREEEEEEEEPPIHRYAGASTPAHRVHRASGPALDRASRRAVLDRVGTAKNLNESCIFLLTPHLPVIF
jgi:hypothetical protein